MSTIENEQLGVADSYARAERIGFGLLMIGAPALTRLREELTDRVPIDIGSAVDEECCFGSWTGIVLRRDRRPC